MTSGTGARRRRRVSLIAIAVLVLGAAAVGNAWSQSGPFGGPRPPAADGIVGWLLTKQAVFYRALAGLIRAGKTDGSAYWGLVGVSFVYGIFHAAGPGHGKAVISSYLLANEETWRRGVTLSFASALLQSVVAIVIVTVAAMLLGATAKMMGDTVRVVEIVSYALIIILGMRLLWVKGRSFLSALRKFRSASKPEPTAQIHDQALHGHGHGCDDHAHGDDKKAGSSHSPPLAPLHKGERDLHAHHHGPGCAHHHDEEASVLPWGHAHGPEPEELAGPGGWRRGLSAIIAVGLRPCSGAIIVLVFALAQGLFWAGVVSTFVMGLGTAITVAAIATLAVGAKAVAKRFAASRNGYGALALRGLEVGAAVLIIAFGALLLTGYMASERMGMF